MPHGNLVTSGHLALILTSSIKSVGSDKVLKQKATKSLFPILEALGSLKKKIEQKILHLPEKLRICTYST